LGAELLISLGIVMAITGFGWLAYLRYSERRLTSEDQAWMDAVAERRERGW
jgi:hypothetical protein